jgi:hypothetical protein
VLRAFPLDFSKNLEIVVVDAWLINPWPDSLIKKIPIAKKKMLLIKEKNNEETNNKATTKKE